MIGSASLDSQQAPWVTVAAILLAVLLIVSWLGFGLPARIVRRFKRTVPERGGYSPSSVDDFLRAIGAPGVAVYRRQLGWDIVFALGLGALLALAVRGLWLPHFAEASWWRLLIWLPVAYAGADVAEDLLLLYAVPWPPKETDDPVHPVPAAPVRAALVATIVKFLTVTLTASVIVGGGAWKALAKPTDPQPVRQVLFDYSMPARFGLDANGDGLTDYMHAGDIQQKTFTVNLDACATKGSIRDYQWTIKTVDDTFAERSTDCRFSLELAEGSYPVTLEVHWRDGYENKREKNVNVRDWLIVSVGDSFASGQGAPQARSGPIPHWQESSCARSANAGAAQAALALEQEDPRTSVTFVHVACSGATIVRGLLHAERAGSAGDVGKSQLGDIRRLVGGRRIDALVLSIGGNDIGFSGIIERCLLLPWSCASGGRTQAVKVRIDALTGIDGPIDTLFACLTGSEACPAGDPELRTAPRRIFVTAYPDMSQHWHKGELRDCRHLSISPTEFEWARTHVLIPLNNALGGAWQRLGASFLTFPPDLWESHGICAKHKWFRGLIGSVDVEGSIKGAFHPNEKGYALGYEPVIMAAFHAADIGPGGRGPR